MQAVINPVVDKPNRYQCRHIFTDGHRCGSPCLRGEELCYYHHNTRKPTTGARQRRSRRSTFDLPLPEDRSAIQSSIGQVLQRIAANDIDPRRAGLLLYGLQIAILNLPKPQPASRNRNKEDEPVEIVEEITIDPELGTIAPRTEIAQEEERLSTVGRLLRKMANPTLRRPKSKTSIPSGTQSCHPPHPPGRGTRSLKPAQHQNASSEPQDSPMQE